MFILSLLIYVLQCYWYSDVTVISGDFWQVISDRWWQVISGNRPWLWVFLIDFLGDLMTTRWVPSSFIIFKWSSIWLQNSHQNHAGGYISIQAKGKHVYVISGWTSTRKRTPHTFRKSAFRFARLSILHLKDTGDPFEGEHLLHLKSTAVEQKVCFYFCVLCR